MAARKRAAADAFGAAMNLAEPWRDQLDCDPRSGRPVGHVWNVAHVLRHHPDWRGVLGFDDFARNIVFHAPPPWGSTERWWTDDDTAALQEWLSDPRVRVLAPDGKVMQAVLRVAQESRCHPPRDYLAGLRWDGEARLPTFMSDYFGAEQNEYTERIGMNWLVSMVARIFEPGCKVDTMPVLEGLQGAGKTESLLTLCGPWYAEATAAVGSKDFLQSLQGVWLMEFAELEAFGKAETSTIKKVLTSREDKFRVPYGRVDQRFPRTVVFCGSTNEDAYLKDPTGARRFWPVRCGSLAVDALRLNRDQLWAEAVHLYESGGDPERWPADAGQRERGRGGWRWWWVPARAQLEQDRRFQADPWEEHVRAWLDGKAVAASYPADVAGEQAYATTTGLLQHAVNRKLPDITKQDEMRMAAILRHLGWHRGRRRMPDGTRPRVYFRDEADMRAAEADEVQEAERNATR